MKQYSSQKGETDLFQKLIVTKSDIAPKLKDISLYDNFDANGLLKELQWVDTEVKAGTNTWQNYYEAIKDQPEMDWVSEFIQNNDLTTVSIEQVEEAQENARQGAIRYNHDLNNLTIGAKAASIGLKALSMIGNMAVFALISKGISALYEKIDNLIHKEEKAAEKLAEMAQKAEEAKSNISSLTDEMKKNADSVNENKDRYAELAQGVNLLNNKNVSLSNDEYEEFLDLTQQLSDIFPQLNQGIDENGNAILNLSGNVDTIVGSLNNLVEAEKQLAQNKIAEEAGEYITNQLPNLQKQGSDIKTKTADYEEKLQELKDEYIGLYDEWYDGIGDYRSEGKVYEKLFNMGIDLNTYEQLEFEMYEGDNGITYERVTLSEEDKKKFLEGYEELYKEYQEKRGELIASMGNELQQERYELEKQNKEFSTVVTSLLPDFVSYSSKYTTDEMRQAIQSMFAELDWSYIDFGGIDTTNIDQVKEFIRTKYVDPIADLEGEVKEQIIELFNNPDLSAIERLNLAKQLQDYFDANKINISLDFMIDASKDKVDKAKNKLGYYNYSPNSAQDAKDMQSAQDLINEYLATLDDKELNNLVDLDIDLSEVAKADTLENLTEYINELKKEASDSPITIGTAFEAATSADKMQKDMQSLLKTLEDYKTNGIEGMDVANISSLGSDDAFGKINNSTAEFERFCKVMEDVNSTEEEVQDAFDKLASAYLYNSDLAHQITEDNKEWTISQLEKNGVTNASAVAEQMLVDKYGAEKIAAQELVAYQHNLGNEKYNTSDATNKLANTTQSEILQFINSANTAGQNTVALSNLLAEKIRAQGITLTTDGDIANLVALCESLDIATGAIKQYYEAKKVLSSGGTITGNGTADTNMMHGLETNYKNTINRLLAKTQVQQNNNSSSYSGGSSGSSSGGSSSKNFEQIIDWIERRIERFKTKFDRWLNQAENSLSTSQLTKYYSKASENLNGLLDTYAKATDKYQKEADKVGLNNTYAKKVRDGSIEIEKITNETLSNRIDSYKEYFDKSQDALDNFISTANEFYNLPIDKATKKVNLFKSVIDSLDKKLENAIGSKSKNSILNAEARREKIIYFFNNLCYTAILSKSKAQPPFIIALSTNSKEANIYGG